MQNNILHFFQFYFNPKIILTIRNSTEKFCQHQNVLQMFILFIASSFLNLIFFVSERLFNLPRGTTLSCFITFVIKVRSFTLPVHIASPFCSNCFISFLKVGWVPKGKNIEGQSYNLNY